MTKNVIDVYFDNLKHIVKESIDSLTTLKKSYGASDASHTLDALANEKDKLIIVANQLANAVRGLDLPDDFDVAATTDRLKQKVINTEDKQVQSVHDANIDGRAAHGATQGVVRGIDVNPDVKHNEKFDSVEDEQLAAKRANFEAAQSHDYRHGDAVSDKAVNHDVPQSTFEKLKAKFTK